jgi:hypothetical protein
MDTYVNTGINVMISGAVFVWMLRIERHMAEIKTTCMLKGGCESGTKAGEDS